MCERLGQALHQQDVSVFDGFQVVALLTNDSSAVPDDVPQRAVCGAIAIDRERLADVTHGITVLIARNVILATGGPGALFRDSVYPQSQFGATGMALRAGAVSHNLTEWQFGLASVGFRWNLSGSYQQVIPRYVSTDKDGVNEREFLGEHFPDLRTLTTAIFRKGYEWPFDCERIHNHGSSLIDLLVYREIDECGRRVFLDYMRNPSHSEGAEEFDPAGLNPEVREYLENSGALQQTPIQRLQALNQPAVDLFRDHGVDLEGDRLEIRVCAQHNNGGLRADIWWESNLRHLFPIGEVCGTHGVRRPGGAALNAGQVGAIRAAHYITSNCNDAPPTLEELAPVVSSQVSECLEFCKRVCSDAGADGHSLSPATVLAEIQDRMSISAAHVRKPEVVATALEHAWLLLQRVDRELRVPRPKGLPMAFRVADLCLTHVVYLAAITAYLNAGGRSRGGALVLDSAGEPCGAALDERWSFARNPPAARVDENILEVRYVAPDEVRTEWIAVRPVPAANGWFEQVWADYRARKAVSVREEV
jgi:succinate dehydrogenase/fumarate reductase flavoprotein subunit